MPRNKKYTEDVSIGDPYETQRGTMVELKCFHCSFSWELKQSRLKNHRADECLNHLRACAQYKQKGNVAPVHARTISAPAIGVPVDSSCVDVLRAQLHEQIALREQQQKQHEESIKIQREIALSLQKRGDEWKRVAKRPFEGFQPSSPSSADDEDTKQTKANRLENDKFIHAKTHAMEEVAAAMHRRSRKMGEGHGEYQSAIKRTAERTNEKLENMTRENGDLREQIHKLEKRPQVTSLKRKIIKLCHPDKAVIQYADVRDMATQVTQSVNEF
jgi:hypothetical protein